MDTLEAELAPIYSDIRSGMSDTQIRGALLKLSDICTRLERRRGLKRRPRRWAP